MDVSNVNAFSYILAIFLVPISTALTKECQQRRIIGNDMASMNCNRNLSGEFKEPPGQWRANICYNISSECKFIKIWLTPAPEKFQFKSYHVALSKIIEDTGPSEKRQTISKEHIKQTTFTFYNLSSGRYRIEVHPHDDGKTCKNRYDRFVPCMKTVTKAIELNFDDSTLSPQKVTDEYLSTRSVLEKTTDNSNTSVVFVKPVHGYSERALTELVPVLLGIACFLASALVTMIICSKLSKIVTPQKSKSRKRITKKTIAIVSPNDAQNLLKIVPTFALFLQKWCYCKIMYFPWEKKRNVFEWISYSMEQADFIIVVISRLNIDQYKRWTNDKSEILDNDFLPCLLNVLSRCSFDQKFSKKVVFIAFEQLDFMLLPEEFGKTKFELMAEFEAFLSHVHGRGVFDCTDNISKRSLKHILQQRECVELLSSIHQIRAPSKSMPFRLDSGYKSQSDNISEDDDNWRDHGQGAILKDVTYSCRDSLQANVSSVGASSISDEMLEMHSLDTTVTTTDNTTDYHNQTPYDKHDRFQSKVDAFNQRKEETKTQSNKFGLKQVSNKLHQQCSQVKASGLQHVQAYNFQHGYCLQAQANDFQQGHCLQAQANDFQNGYYSQLQAYVSEEQEHHCIAAASKIHQPNVLMPNSHCLRLPFISPEPSLLDEDIVSQDQYKMMSEINNVDLKPTAPEIIDNISGYSV